MKLKLSSKKKKIKKQYDYFVYETNKKNYKKKYELKNNSI